jgi:prepilin-type N-terminal cleavage/methylation domain-containing protein
MKWVDRIMLEPWFPAAIRWRIERRREGLKKEETILGLTLIELLVVIAILGIAVTGTMLIWRVQQVKAYDATRKEDLRRYAVAFEDYFNDYGCYPPATMLSNCGSSDFMPYMQKVECDPVSQEPYGYYPLSNCTGYELYTSLQNEKDDDIFRLGCDTGCGPTGEYNYGIAFGTTLTAAVSGDSGGGGGDSGATPTPPGGNYACDPYGECNLYEDPEEAGCPITFVDAVTCQNACDQSSNNWCKR